MKTGSEATGRLLAPYYPLLLLPILVNPGQVRLLRRNWLEKGVVITGAVAILALVVTPARPLWPALTVCQWLEAWHPHNMMLVRATKVYSVYRHRSDMFDSLLQYIPSDVKSVGLIEGGDDTESCFWRPFGARRIVNLVGNERIEHPGLMWVIVKESEVSQTSVQFNKWVAQTGGEQIISTNILSRAGSEAVAWTVLRYHGISKQIADKSWSAQKQKIR
jgi:hypothetical protein